MSSVIMFSYTDVPMRLAPDRSLVPQSHAPHSSDEEDDSADSDAAGASRLLLAQSAPQKRRGLRNHHTAARGSKAAPPSTSKRKSFSRQPRARVSTETHLLPSFTSANSAM